MTAACPVLEEADLPRTAIVSLTGPRGQGRWRTTATYRRVARKHRGLGERQKPGIDFWLPAAGLLREVDKLSHDRQHVAMSCKTP